MQIGDGLCDGVNNNNKCEFDGGDCCIEDDEECLRCYGDFCNCHLTGNRMCGGMTLDFYVLLDAGIL